MADKITQVEKDQAIALDLALKDRKKYIQSGTFVTDEIAKIDGFLASPNLGVSMRNQLTETKKVLVENPKTRKDKELTLLDLQVAENNKILAKEVETSVI